jgi:hypothetical protein
VALGAYCWWGKEKCIHCDRFNHASDDCYFKDKPKTDKKGKGRANPRKRSRNQEANVADSDQPYAAIEDVGEGSSGITFDSSEDGQFFNFDNKNVASYSMNDEPTLYYGWLADSATTSHITNRRDTFIAYEPIKDTPITGVGGLQAQAEGRGDVRIDAVYKGVVYPIRLCGALGRWLAKGGDFLGRKLALSQNRGGSLP